MPRIRRLGIAAVMTAAIALGGAPAFAAEAVGGAEAVVTSASTLQHAGFGPDAHRVAARSTSPSRSSSSGSTEHGRGFLWLVAAACIGLISLAIKGTKDSQESESASPEPAPTSDDTARRARLKAREERLRAAEEAHHRVQGANKRLVEAAELVRTAEQEWDYARAQFGLSATERFHRQVEEAKAALSRGYDTQKRIQAAVVPQTRMRLAAEMSNDLDAAVSPLRAATAEFTAKRAEHAALPSRIAQARERLAEELSDLERAREELASIATIYPAKTLASLQGNPERAAQLLESARDALETASATVTKDNARAASALDTAQRALTMANAQTDAIFSAKTDLDAFRERLTVSLGSVSTALTDAKQLDPSDAFSPLLDEAEAAITRGQRALVSDEDPLGALEYLRDVELRLEAVLAPLMTQEDARRKAKETAQRHIRDADAALTWARKYLKDHEGSALLDVNKLMSEAEEAMTEARKVLDEDPLRASAAASRATTLANRALAAPGRR